MPYPQFDVERIFEQNAVTGLPKIRDDFVDKYMLAYREAYLNFKPTGYAPWEISPEEDNVLYHFWIPDILESVFLQPVVYSIDAVFELFTDYPASCLYVFNSLKALRTPQNKDGSVSHRLNIYINEKLKSVNSTCAFKFFTTLGPLLWLLRELFINFKPVGHIEPYANHQYFQTKEKKAAIIQLGEDLVDKAIEALKQSPAYKKNKNKHLLPEYEAPGLVLPKKAPSKQALIKPKSEKATTILPKQSKQRKEAVTQPPSTQSRSGVSSKAPANSARALAARRTAAIYGKPAAVSRTNHHNVKNKSVNKAALGPCTK